MVNPAPFTWTKPAAGEGDEGGEGVRGGGLVVGWTLLGSMSGALVAVGDGDFRDLIFIRVPEDER